MTLSASLQPLASDPPTFALRLHPRGGSWEAHSDYDGVAIIQVYGAVATAQGMLIRRGRGSRKSVAAMMDVLTPLGVRALIGTHGPEARLTIWIVPQQGE